MEYVDYRLTNDELIPAVVTIGDRMTPVWRQNRWSSGEYQDYIVRNGCGHCCTAMALNLYGITIDPHQEFSICRKLWGEPKRDGKVIQDNFQSVSGITKILNYHGVSAEYFGVSSFVDVEKHFKQALNTGKQIIFWSTYNEKFPENPFSKDNHYVIAVGYTKDYKILVANSSERWAKNGVQLVDIPTIVQTLYLGADPVDTTWGQFDFERCAGYVIVG